MNEERKLPLVARIILWCFLVMGAFTILNAIIQVIKLPGSAMLSTAPVIVVQALVIFVVWKVRQLKLWALRLFNIWVILTVLTMLIVALNPGLVIVSVPAKAVAVGLWLMIVLHAGIFAYFNFGPVKEYFKKQQEG